MESNKHKHISEDDEYSHLPKEKWTISPYLYSYQNFWCPSNVLPNVIALQSDFQAQQTDILLATKPKSGTTWLKALAFTILHRNVHPIDIGPHPHPLLSSTPQALVPFLEYPPPGAPPLLHLSKLAPPRLLSTHLPYSALPKSLKSCRIVYICRNPFDTIVSYLKFKEKLDKGKSKEDITDLNLEECVDSFCTGVEGFGPHWDHVLGYWNTSLENPEHVLFLKYEDLKTNEANEIRKLARFLGVPFSPEEEETGIVDEIIKLCSFGNLKELEVNKSGLLPHFNVENSNFFRKGEVGDWKNHFSPVLFDRVNKVIQDKFHGTGLTFTDS